MVRFLRLGLAHLFFLFLFKGNAQVFNTLQTKRFKTISDTLVLDSLSLVPGSISFKIYPERDSTFIPRIDVKRHALIFSDKKPDSLSVTYRRFPYNFERRLYHKDADILYKDLSRPNNPFTINYKIQNQENLFQNDGLTKNGNISRGISFGNNQDVVVNSNLNLQVNGKLTPEIDMVMAATDNNIPFQADGTTAQLQEFDKVYIQLSNYNTKMIVGDYQLSKPQNSYFMNFYKRAQGLYLENNYRDSSSKKHLIFKTQITGAVSRGKFSRQVFFGTESNQGPYRLRGANNETFIIILSGTEKIYIDGKLLQRGQENDYIVDYNSAEITFTAKQIITKDKRIVAEFQYAERNYARSLFFFGEEVELNKAKIYMNYFSEQDNKNRPLQQNLNQLQKNVLIDAGDSLNKAYYTGATQTPFNNSQIFYRKLDTVVANFIYPDVYVFSSNPDSALYTLQFSNVGFGKGNYNQVSSSANGKTYVWKAPINGQLQGSFEPVIPLVAPKKNQMLTMGATYSITTNHLINAEGVYSNNNINTFSGKDKRNDEGSGVKISSKNQNILSTDSLKQETKVLYNLNYEFVQQRFSQIERFRSIEFDRDWNRPLTGLLRNDQHIASTELGLAKSNKIGMNYSFHLFEEGTSYEGIRHNVSGNYSDRNYKANYNGSYLFTTDKINSQRTKFYRHSSSISKKIERARITYSDVFENNLFFQSKDNNLVPKAYQFWEWEGSVANADSSKNAIKLFYKERRDKLAYYNDTLKDFSRSLKDSTLATNIGLKSSIYSLKNNPFTILVTYRKLDLKKNVVGQFLKSDNTLLNRLEYNPKYFKGLITSSIFYETGYGQENKREFYYLEVAPGQGQFAWIDYNNNGIKELNEFENSKFADQAKFIRIYAPTNQYVKVLQNQLSVSLSIRPSVVLKKSSLRISRFANRWALQTALRLDNKISAELGKDSYNPFAVIRDTFLLGSNNNTRHSIFFNQGSAVFGADYTYINNKSRQLLTNGIETRELLSHEVKWRFNLLKSWSLTSENNFSQKTNISKFFPVRNYLIAAYETEQRLIFQPNTVFRMSGIFKYSDKQNNISENTKEKATIKTLALELKYNQTEKGSLTGRLDLIKIAYNGAENSSVAYEMLNGLKAGDNFTWELSYQRNLNNSIQVSINYNGRKTPGAGSIHLGGAQVRAFF